MPTTQVQRLHHCALAAVFLATLTTTATAGSFLRGCAARDMQILTLIEERETAKAVSAEQLRDAMHTLMHARIVCHEGYVVDALSIYDKIAQSIAPNPVFVGRAKSTEIQ
jgi:hypothetical protein